MNRLESIKWIRKTCGEGWIPLVEEIYDQLPEGTTITEIYQKWGALNFTATPWSDLVEHVYEKTEERSLEICEKCGQPGSKTTINEWVHTRCAKHT